MLGGYVAATNGKLWGLIFETLGGENVNSAAAVVMKKHYEK